ncbi:MAG: phosphoribosyltransferase [Archaeoglobales archaeon]|nr:MAG: phosphoribosyltransferase [Archaeoglobales archaeon]
MRYRDRSHAGKELAKLDVEFDIIAAVPRGGVIVGAEIARVRKKPLLIVGVRKLPIPWSPEAGFGAIAEDCTVYLNDRIVRRAGISEEVIREVANEVKMEVKRRVRTYRKGEIPDLSGNTVLLIDDGFATGYTAIAAIGLLRKKNAKKIIAASPCAPVDTFELLKKHADEVVVLNVQDFFPFAVGDYYEDFRELSDDDVLKAIEGIKVL